MKTRILFRFQFAHDLMTDLSSTDSKFIVQAEVLEAFFEIVGVKGEIGIEFHKKIPLFALKGLVAFVERLHYTAARLAEASVLPMNDADPRMFRSVALNDLACMVTGSVIHYDPFRWP
jgi:hypothetical protein